MCHIYSKNYKLIKFDYNNHGYNNFTIDGPFVDDLIYNIFKGVFTC